MTQVRMTAKLANASKRALAWLAHPQAIPEKWSYAVGLRSASGLRLPNFLGIGAQKAGTTWLYENLRHHPGIFFPPELKEVRFFDARYYTSLRGYADLFAPAGERMAGEITPNYGALPASRIRFIRKVMPEVKLLFLMRNPIDRAWSHALMDLVTRPGRVFEEVPEWEFLRHFEMGGARKHGCYASMLERWQAVFPREQFHVAFFEDVRTRPRELLTDVFEHLGVSLDVDWQSFPYQKRIFKGPSIELPEKFRPPLVELFRREIEKIAETYGAPADRWLEPAADPLP